MAYRNGRWEPDIPPPPPPRAPGGGSTLPQNNNRTAAPPPPPAPGVPPPPPTPPPPRPPGSPSGNVPTGRPNPNFSGAQTAGAPPPPPGGQPPPDYNNYQPQGWQQEDARKAAGTWQDDNADAGKWNTGDPYLDELRSGKVAGSEDWRRFSNAQLKEWEPYYLGNGQYRTFDGGVSDKPTNTTKDDGSGGGGGGGGGGGRGGGGAPQNPQYMDEMTTYWKNLVANQDKSRYSPEAMAAIEADQFARARAQEKNQLEDAKADMAQRGVTGSANQNATMRGIRGNTGNAIMNQRSQVVRAKIDADYQDKQAAINNAKEWVNSMRDYMLRTDMNAIQREQIAAQIRLANMNIDAQSNQLEQQYQNNLSTYLLTNGG